MRRLLTYFHYGFELFCMRFWINLLLVIELVISIVAINLSVSSIEGLYVDLNMIKSLDSNTLFVMPTRDLVNTKPDEYLELDEIYGEYSIGEQYYSSINTPFSHNSIIMYNNEIITNFSIPLLKGSWKAPIIIDNGVEYYPVIISNESTVKFGESFEAVSDSASIYCYVAGVLGNQQRYIKLSSTSNVASTQQLIGNCKDELVFFCNTEYFPLELFAYISECSNKILFFEEVSSQEMDKNTVVLRNQAFVFSREDIIENSMESIKNNVGYYVPLVIGIFSVSLMGLLSFSLFSICKNRGFYRTAVLCGASRKDCVAIGVINYIWMLIFSLGIIITIYAIANFTGFMFSESIWISKWNLLITAFVYALVFLCGNLIPIAFFSKKRHKNITA